MSTGFQKRRPAVIRGMSASELHELGCEDDDDSRPRPAVSQSRSGIGPTIIRHGHKRPPSSKSLETALGMIPVDIDLQPDSTLVRLSGGTESNFLFVDDGNALGAKHGSGEGPDFSDRLSRDHERTIDALCGVGA